MEKINRNKYLKLVLKVCLSAVAVYVVVKKIDLAATWQILVHTDLPWLLPALVVFNLSKIISAFRLEGFFRCLGINLARIYNLRLYYVGMFYNLFLPGGIGGDGYKVYLLHKYYKTPVKGLVAASLLDRISGLMALCFLAFVLFLFINLTPPLSGAKYVVAGALILSYPLYYILYRMLFNKFIGIFFTSGFLSLAVQLAQLVSAWFILLSLDISVSFMEYQELFLISSVVSVLPFTIGGVGARELVFVFGAQYLMIDKNTAVAFSILFFLITAISSFTGIFFETTVKNVNSGLS